MQCLIIDDIVLLDEKGFLHPGILDFYEDYWYLKISRGETPLGPKEWIPATRGTARKFLAGLLKENIRNIVVRSSLKRLVSLGSIPRPGSLTDRRIEDLLQYLLRSDNSPKTWERLGRFENASDEPRVLLRQDGQVSQGHLNILKGNIGEVFSLPLQLRKLAEIKRLHPIDFINAKIISGIRIRRPGTVPQLFSDNIIATELPNGNLQVHMVFEVKGGYRGGAEAQVQIFNWIEGRIDDGTELIIPANARYHDITGGGEHVGSGTEALIVQQRGQLTGQQSVFRYDPQAIGDGPRVIDLVSAQRQIITARGWSQIGIDPSLTSIRDPDKLELGISSEELDYLMVSLLRNRYGAVD